MTRLSVQEREGRGEPPVLRAGGALTPGIVHLGAGAFFRAHTAYLTELAMLESGERDWGIIAVTQRSNAVAEQLEPQDGLFTVTEREPRAVDEPAPRPRVVSSVVGVIDGRQHPERVVHAIAAPEIRVVTLTITEKGYRFDPLTRHLDLQDEGVQADLGLDHDDAAPQSAIGQLVFGLLRRHATGAGPLTVIPCDNLPHNGRLTETLVREFLARLRHPAAPDFLPWFETDVAFPSTMVDRMVPATSDAAIDDIERNLGARDEAAVTAERFWQWVIEDRFAGPIPAWQRIGATITSDVAAWEDAKLRLLNAAHSMLAYLGTHAGHETIAEAAQDPALAVATERMLRTEALPSLELPEGLDGARYCTEVLARFANPALGHTCAKVGADGSQKLAVRILPTVEAVVAAGSTPTWAALALAAWVRHVETSDPGTLDDPRSSELQATASRATDASDLVHKLFAEGAFFALPSTRRPSLLAAILDWHGVLVRADPAELERRTLS